MPVQNFFTDNCNFQIEGRDEDEISFLIDEALVNIETLPNPFEKENEDEGIIDIESYIDKNEQLKRADPSQFTILSVLGEGSFGKVYAVQKDTGVHQGQYFAMKVLKKATLKVRDLIRSKTERNILAEISHPFIVKLHFAFQTEQKLFLIIDLVKGGDLFDFLSKKLMFTEDDAKFYLAEIAMALAHLHGVGIIYRDLKPENVLLEIDGHIKLTDFGLCKEAIQNEKKTYSFCGTIEYMAPEVITQRGHGTAADWWSFGVLMYEMLAGAPPFHSPNYKEIMTHILKARLAMPVRFSPEAQQILRLLFKRNPANRLGSSKGLDEIKSQPFFETIDFARLFRKEIVPPFKPAIPINFESNLFFNRDIGLCTESPRISSANTQLFKGFSFVAPLSDDKNTEYTMKNSTITTEETLGFLPVKTSNIQKDYIILEAIGEGSFGTVKKAAKKSNKLVYAIKIVDSQKRDCREEIDILLRYSEHPNIVTLRDVFVLENSYYLIMEFLRGGDLLTKINKQKCYSEREAAELMDVLVSTIAYLHEHRVVHRDLKPSNIMFSDDSGKRESVRITDFGFAKQIRAENGLLMTPCYTANFVAPEVLKKQGYDAACDIWSLGVVLYVLISGITPYMNQDEKDSNIILNRITHGQIDLTNGVWTKVSKEAKQLIYSMVHLDSSVRPTANQILTYSWIVNKSQLSNVRLQQDTWRLKDAMKIMFSAFRSSNEVKSFSNINNSGILRRRALKKNFKP